MLVTAVVCACIVFFCLVIKLFLTLRADRIKPEVPASLPLTFEPFLTVTASDVTALANTGFMERMEVLICTSNVENKLPAFYEKYTELTKSCKEQYFQHLLELFMKGKGRWLDKFLKKYPEVSVQDTLMLYMLETGFDNRTIARLLMINYETLKKRKLRLKAKFKAVGLIVDLKPGIIALLSQQLAEP